MNILKKEIREIRAIKKNRQEKRTMEEQIEKAVQSVIEKVYEDEYKKDFENIRREIQMLRGM